MAKIKNKIKFWIVYSTFNLKLPIKPYLSRTLARNAAKELSIKNPDCEYYVLEATHHICTDATEPIESTL